MIGGDWIWRARTQGVTIALVISLRETLFLLMLLLMFVAGLAGAAEILHQAGDQKGVPSLDHLVRLRPSDPTSHAMLAELAYARSDCKNALEHFEQTRAVTETQPTALQQYGDCLAEEGQTERVVSVFQQLLAANPESSQARRNLANAQNMAGHADEARAMLLPLLETSDPEVSTLRAWLQQSTKTTAILRKHSNCCATQSSAPPGTCRSM